MPGQAKRSSRDAAFRSKNLSKRSLFFEPQDVATVKVEGKAFKVHKAILVKDSDYFEKALNGPFIEGQTQTIDLGDDVEAGSLALYVDILYRSYFVEDFRLHRDHFNSELKTRSALLLWMLSDRFLNCRLRDIAAKWLDEYLETYTIAWWEASYSREPASKLWLHRMWIGSLEKAFNCCQEYRLPYADKIVQAVAKIPPQLFSEVHDALDPDFRFALTKNFIRRFEDPSLKRPSEQTETDEGKGSAKRQKRG